MAMHVYIIHSESRNRYYTGITTLPKKPPKAHVPDASAWKSPTGEWRAVWTSEVPDIETARKLEKSIKTLGARQFLYDQRVSMKRRNA